jgi:hypothetical protein
MLASHEARSVDPGFEKTEGRSRLRSRHLPPKRFPQTVFEGLFEQSWSPALAAGFWYSSRPPFQWSVSGIVRRRMPGVLGLALVALAGLTYGGLAAAHASRPPSSVADRAACAHPTPVTGGVAHLKHFDVYTALLTDRVARSPLYPHYPDRLLPVKIAIHPHQKLQRPVTISARLCRDWSVIRLWFKAGDPPIPRPASAAIFAHAGMSEATLAPGEPPITDPLPEYVGFPFYFRPGRAILRFKEGSQIIDRLVVVVCIANGTAGCAL